MSHNEEMSYVDIKILPIKQGSKPFQMLTISVLVFLERFSTFSGFGLGYKIGFSIFLVLISG